MLYSNVELENSACTFVSDAADVATVTENGGVVTAVGTGTAYITVTYKELTDKVKVVVA